MKWTLVYQSQEPCDFSHGEFSYVHEVEYQESNPANKQERYICTESFDFVKDCLKGKRDSIPQIKLPFDSIIDLDVDNCIRWKRQFRDWGTIVGMAYIINKKQIPYDVYIIELETKGEK